MLENFKNECKNDAYNNRLGKVIYDDIKEITHNDNLASLELTEDCYVNGNIIGTTNTKSIKINTIGKPNIFNGKLENGSIDKDGQNGVSPELDTTTFIELKEKLNSINDVADEHDVISGKGIKRIGECVLTGDESIIFEKNGYIRARIKIDNSSKEGSRKPIISNYFKYALAVNDEGTGFMANGCFYFYLPKEYTTEAQYKQWLKDRYNEGNPVIFKWILETPQEFTTEPVNIQLRKGYNRIEIKDKNGLLNKTKLSYLADTEKTVEGTNSIIIDDAEPVNVRSLVVYGNSYQETEPSPEFPSEIKCVEGLGNIFDLDRFIEEYNKVAKNPSYKENGFDYFAYADAPSLKYMQGEFKENTQYTFNVKGYVNNYASGNFTGFIFYYTDNTHSEVRLNSGNLSNYTFSSTANKTINYIGLNSSGGKGMFVKDICLYEDNMQLPYLPYGKNYLKLVDTGKNFYDFKNTNTITSGITTDDEGWITINGNSSVHYYNYYTYDLDLEEKTSYLIALEIKEISGTGTLNAISNIEDAGQFSTGMSYSFEDLKNGDVKTKILTTKASFSKLFHSFGLRTFASFTSGQSGSITFRLSVLEDTSITPENFVYIPYVPNKVRNTEKFAIEKSTYTIDLNGATDVYLFFYDENDNLISKSGYHKLPYTFNNVDAKYVRFMFKDANNDYLDVNDITDIQINDKFSLYGKDVDVNVGVKYDDDSEEYIELGKYTIDKPNDEETVNLGEYKGYDYLDKLNDNYVCTIEDFTSATVSDVLQDLCNQCGLEIDNLEFENNDFPVNGNIFENYKCKDVLSDILELACSIGIISKDSNKLVFRKLSKESSVTLTKNDYSLLTKNQIYGPVNSFSIKESQIEGENVTIQDDESIKNNGETEFSIVDNIFLYTPELRQLVLDSIWNNIKGLTYYDCKIESYHGLPYLNAGDKITVEDDNGNYFDTYVLKHTFTYDGTFKSVIESPALTKQQTNIKSDVSLREKLNQTVINVYKDKKIIDALITENTEQGSKITQLELNTDDITARMEQNETSIQNTNDNLEHNYYQRTQVEEMVLNSASGVTNTFSEAGGNNILRNTDFSAKEVLEEGQEYEYWYGSAERLINSESANGYSIKIKKSNFYQEQNVANGNYTLSFYYKITNSLANVKVQINGQEYALDSTNFALFQTGIKNEDGTYKIEPINISDNHLKIEFITDIDDSIEIYDIMCNAGSVKLAYSQNANETRTDTVNIGKGITITSSTSDTKFVATPEIMGFKSVNGDKMITEFTNKGMTTKEAVVEDEAEIVGIIRQKVGNQIWDAVTGV